MYGRWKSTVLLNQIRIETPPRYLTEEVSRHSKGVKSGKHPDEDVHFRHCSELLFNAKE